MTNRTAKERPPTVAESGAMKILIAATTLAMILVPGGRAQQGEAETGQAGISPGSAVRGSGTHVATSGAIGTRALVGAPGIAVRSTGFYGIIPIDVRVPLRSRYGCTQSLHPALIYNDYSRLRIGQDPSTYCSGASDVRGVGSWAGGYAITGPRIGASSENTGTP